MAMDFIAVIVILLMLVCNALFAAYEMALASISHSRLLTLANQKKKGARAAATMKERMEASLAVVQLGITLVGAVAAATGGAGVNEWLMPRLQQNFGWSTPVAAAVSLILFVIPLSAFTIVFAELVPKMFAIHNKEWVCLVLSPPMYALSRIIYPVVSVLETAVKAVIRGIQRVFRTEHADSGSGLHELKAAVAVARTARLIGAREERILLSASQFPIRPVREIQLPAADISMIPIESSLTDALLRAHLDLHTRFPVSTVEDDPQTIAGYITFKDLVVTLKMNPTSGTLREIVRPMRRFPEEMSIANVLEFMIRERVHIALVESTAGAIVGMITLEDIIEELVGDIEDEYDRLPSHIHPTAAGWILGGAVHMDTIASLTGFPRPDPLPSGRAMTFAEWATAVLGRPVKKGEIFQNQNLSINVRKLRRRKLAEAFVSIVR